MSGNQGKYLILYKQYKEILEEKKDKKLLRYMMPIDENFN